MINFQDFLDIKVVLADDHEVVRAGLKRLLTIDKNIKILDEASNGEDAVKLVNYHRPDVAILDILMPRKDGIEATKIIKLNTPEVFVVILTAFEDAHHLEQALEAGADGYLTKDIGARDLVEALHTVVKGERVFSRSIIHLLQKNYNFKNDDSQSSTIVITAREQEVLNMVALGKTSSQIADEMNISVRTVQTHRSNIMQKLGLKTASSLVRYAVLRHQKNIIDKTA